MRQNLRSYGLGVFHIHMIFNQSILTCYISFVAMYRSWSIGCIYISMFPTVQSVFSTLHPYVLYIFCIHKKVVLFFYHHFCLILLHLQYNVFWGFPVVIFLHLSQDPFESLFPQSLYSEISSPPKCTLAARHCSIFADDNRKKFEERYLQCNLPITLFIKVKGNGTRMGIASLCGRAADGIETLQRQMDNYSLITVTALPLVQFTQVFA